MDSKVVMLVMALALTGLCGAYPVAPDHHKTDDEIDDEICYEGTGRDCFTVLTIILMGTAIAIGSALLTGGLVLGCLMRFRHEGRGRRMYLWFAKCFCCETPEDDSLIQVIVDNNTSRTSNVEEDIRPEDVEQSSQQTGATSAMAKKDDDENSTGFPGGLSRDTRGSPLLPSQIKQEPASAPSSPKEEVVQAEAAAPEAEIVSKNESENLPTNEAEVQPNTEPTVVPKTEPESPQTYAEAAKANGTRQSNTSRPRGRRLSRRIKIKNDPRGYHKFSTGSNGTYVGSYETVRYRVKCGNEKRREDFRRCPKIVMGNAKELFIGK